MSTRYLSAIAVALLAFSSSVASADQEYYTSLAVVWSKKQSDASAEVESWKASQHGFSTAIFDLKTCNDVVTVTDPELRAEFDRKYRRHRDYRLHYDLMYKTGGPHTLYMNDKINLPRYHLWRFIECTGAVRAVPWLSFDPGGRELLEKAEKKFN